ncbi:MAG TPA: cupin domain-containing protein [Candidatus Polarisedimenticolia bacterium]|nr:cupin domain-containing protein [Candidatus Polarisedimenticolia bacterium]
MNKINLTEISIEKNRSPKGRFRRWSQHISQALAGVNGIGASGIEQPFEVDLVRIPAGATNWPFHSHSAKWELYLIITGRGYVRTADGTSDLREGDCIIHPPGEAHQITNTGATDLVYYIVSDSPRSDVRHFPDTNKWQFPGQPGPVRVSSPANSCYDGEE